MDTAKTLNDQRYAPSGDGAGTSEAVVHPDCSIYRVTGAIEILAVLHARQRYP